MVSSHEEDRPHVLEGVFPPSSLNGAPIILKAPGFCDHPHLIALHRMRRAARQIAIAHCGIVLKYGPLSSQAKAASGAIGSNRDDEQVIERLRLISQSG